MMGRSVDTVMTQLFKICHRKATINYEGVKCYSAWGTLELNLTQAQLTERLAWWRELNDWSVKERGGHKHFYMSFPMEVNP